MKTVLQQARIDFDVLYANMFGLTDSQKKLVDEWLETYLPAEREQIESAVKYGRDGKLSATYYHTAMTEAPQDVNGDAATLAYVHAMKEVEKGNLPLMQRDYYRNGFYDGYSLRQRDWISVSDRLPEKDGRYMFWDSKLNIIQVFDYNAQEPLHKHYTHWQPLPLPPNEK